jgi:hypothetical protein
MAGMLLRMASMSVVWSLVYPLPDPPGPLPRMCSGEHVVYELSVGASA